MVYFGGGDKYRRRRNTIIDSQAPHGPLCFIFILITDMGGRKSMVSASESLVGDVFLVLYFYFCEQIRVWT